MGRLPFVVVKSIPKTIDTFSITFNKLYFWLNDGDYG